MNHFSLAVLSLMVPIIHALPQQLLPVDLVFLGSLAIANQTESELGNLPSTKATTENSDVNYTVIPDCQSSHPGTKSLRILKGSEVGNSTKYPWMASIRLKNARFCSGSIISESKILTALHCTLEEGSNVELSASDYTVYVGSNEIHGPFEFSVNSIVRPQTDEPRPDFAILVLSQALPLDDPSVKPVCLSGAPTEDLSPGTVVTTMGWGKPSIEYGPLLSPLLKEATIAIVPDSICRHHDDTNFFCAKHCHGVTCTGDDGGPVVTQRDGKYRSE